MTESLDDQKTKILIVDDLKENLFSMKLLLEKLDIAILTAQSGNEALALMLSNEFAVVLLDVQMPEMNGFEVAELMRQNERTCDTPIIFVTAISKENRHIHQGYDSGAIDYIFKPIDPQVLLCKVKIFCQLYKQKSTLEDQADRLEKQNEILQKQLAEIKELRGLLPICACCKKIRDTEGSWEQIELYISKHSNANFSHGYCPECFDKMIAKLEASTRASTGNSSSN